MHLKTCHTLRETNYVCEDCDLIGDNEYTVEVHHGKCHSSGFDCGLCDYKAKSLNKSKIHLSTCEIYECDDCYFRVKTLYELKAHMQELHENENTKIIHAKLNRKDEDIICSTEHWRNELFGDGN